MSISRRELLAASGLLLAGSKLGVPTSAAAATATSIAPAGNLITMCWNENPYGPGPAARKVLAAAIAGSCRYPDDEVPLLLDAIAKKEGLSAANIVIGAGSGEVLRAAGLLVARDAGEIVAAEPSYLELPNYARHLGATVKFVPVDKAMQHDLAAMRAAVNARTRAIYVCNPNNPTGTALPAAAIAEFVDSLPETVTTIVDEAYLDFADAAGVRSVVDLVAADKRVVVLRTFSKIHGMAGVRCGYGLTRTDIAAQIEASRMTTPNIFAMRAALASLGDHAFLTDTRRRIIASRNRINAELKRLGLGFAEPQGNFVFFDTGMPLAHFTELMLARKIRVGRRFPPFETWCRITIGTEPEVDAFLTALRAIKAA